MRGQVSTVRVRGLTPAQAWRCEEAVRALDPSDAADRITWGGTWFEGSPEQVGIVLDCLGKLPEEFERCPEGVTGGVDMSWDETQRRIRKAKESCQKAADKVRAALEENKTS